MFPGNVDRASDAYFKYLVFSLDQRLNVAKSMAHFLHGGSLE